MCIRDSHRRSIVKAVEAKMAKTGQVILSVALPAGDVVAYWVTTENMPKSGAV